MKKNSFIPLFITIVMLFQCMGFFMGCGNTSVDVSPRKYVIQYTDDSGIHQISVTHGMPYSLDIVPEKTGYTFLGLFDAEVGGKQYISSNGASLTPFIEEKSLVLFPQFKAKDYSVILDYQGAAVTGSRQFVVAYGSNLPELPKDLTGEHKEFIGWYTQANCKGTQIADKYGLLPVVSVLSETNFDLRGENITLYAGFEWEKYTVTCHFGEDIANEVLEVEYDTPVSQIVTETRVNGKAPLTWSKTLGGEVWNDKITGNVDLFAVEYAPVIEFDSNGGSEVKYVVARAGSTISLPTPTKDLAKFSYWEDMQGNRFVSTTMPSTSILLKAVWQAKLVFDSNGGSDVDDISVASGTKISLPIPERDGFVFAGWYIAEKEQYTSTTMPSTGLFLKAGWYKEKKDTKILIDSNKHESSGSLYDVPKIDVLFFTIDCREYLNKNTNTIITIEWFTKVQVSNQENVRCYVDFYSNKQISSAYLIETKSFPTVMNEYKEISFKTSFTIADNFYCCWYSSVKLAGYARGMSLSDFYYIVHYPDTTNLYL